MKVSAAWSLWLTVSLGMFAAPVQGATWQVAAFGSDSSGCGTSSAPCRTISQAITNANAGDTIVVGPGLYGDVNGDGDLNDPGEENSGLARKTIVISKPLSLVSRAGAASTIVRNIGNADAIYVGAARVTVGKKGRGFTVRGGAPGSVGVRVDPSVDTVSLMGNVFDNHGGGLGIVQGTNLTVRNNWWLNGTLTIGGSSVLVRDNLFIGAKLATGASSSAVTIDRNEVNRSTGVGIDLEGSSHTVRRNVVVGGLSGAGFRCAGTCTGIVFADNVSRGNNGHGFEILAGSGHGFTGNLAAANASSGFYFNLPTAVSLGLLRNTAVGNGAAGFTFAGPTDSSNFPTLTNCVSVGNHGDGIQVSGYLVVEKSSIYSNVGSGFNCGIYKLSALGSVVATGNFWGSSSGPGPDPADGLCGMTTQIDASNPLSTEVKVSLPRLP